MVKFLSAKNINQIINHGIYFVKFFQIPDIFQKMLYTVKFAGVLIAHKGFGTPCLAESFFKKEVEPFYLAELGSIMLFSLRRYESRPRGRPNILGFAQPFNLIKVR